MEIDRLLRNKFYKPSPVIFWIKASPFGSPNFCYCQILGRGDKIVAPLVRQKPFQNLTKPFLVPNYAPNLALPNLDASPSMNLIFNAFDPNEENE